MILKSCYVEGFGKLREFRYEFDKGLNSLVRDNGWGKTTFAAFVKAMLYGLPSSKSRNLLENERKRYEPWDRGRFGGSLTFEARGKTYRVVRYFGDKESEDYFCLYDTATEEQSHDFSANLGVELFSVDAESYMKSAFIGANEENRFGKIPTVQERLTASVESEDSAVSYEKAIEILEKQRKVYKLIGNKGKIGELEAEIENLKIAVSQSERDRVEAERLAAEEAEIEKALVAIEKKETELADAEVQSRTREASESMRRHAATLLSDAVTAEKSRDALRLSFGEELPTEELLSSAETAVEALHELRIRAANERVSDTDVERKRRILDAFGGIAPTEELLRREAAEKNAAAMRDYNEKRAAADAERVRASRKKRLRAIILFVTAAVFAAVGALLLSPAIYAAIPFFALCGFNALFAAVLLLLPVGGADDGLLPPEATLDQSRLQALYEYERIEKDEAAAEERAQMLRAEYAEKEAQLSLEAARYGESVGSAAECFSSLRRRLLQYRAACEVATTLRQRYAAYVEEHPDAARAIETEAVPASVMTLDGERRILVAEKLRLQEKRDRIRRAVLPIRANADRAAERRDRITALEGELFEARRRFDAIEKAKKYLSEAKNSLSTRYLSDMQAAFSHYMSLLLPNAGSRGVLAADLSLKVENGGMRYDPIAFSDGTRDVLSFCVHLSLHDALFENEKPVLILDDSFANLDGATLSRAKDFLRELSSSVQILYFTCHESRDI